jgi:hypothetical protein
LWGQLGWGRRFRRRCDHGACVRLGHAQALRQFLHGSAGGLPQGAQCRPEDHQEDMNPLMGFALAHPEQPPLHDLEGVRLEVDEDKQQPILGRGQRTVLIGRVPASGARLSIEAPLAHLSLERRFKRPDQRAKLVHGETGEIEYLGGTGLEIGEPSRSHGGGLLSSEAQDTINRD